MKKVLLWLGGTVCAFVAAATVVLWVAWESVTLG